MNERPLIVERRKRPRYSVRELAAVLHGDYQILALMTDISAGGAMIEGQLPLVAGERVYLAFDVFEHLQARIAQKGAGYCGLEFLHQAEERERLVAWIRQRALARRQGMLRSQMSELRRD